MRLIGYVRVSTAGQVRDGLGLPTQERMIREWTKAAGHGHKLGRIIADEGRTGTLPEAERPGLLETLNALKAGEAQGVVVPSLDRLARSLTVQEAVLARVWSTGSSMFTADAGEILRDDPDDPMRTFVRQVMGAVAQLDRALIVKRLRNGRRTAIERGRRGSGASPYGWKAENGALVPVPAEQAVLERIHELRADGASFATIAGQLNAEGVPAKRGRWHPSSVGAAINRA